MVPQCLGRIEQSAAVAMRYNRLKRLRCAMSADDLGGAASAVRGHMQYDGTTWPQKGQVLGLFRGAGPLRACSCWNLDEDDKSPPGVTSIDLGLARLICTHRPFISSPRKRERILRTCTARGACSRCGPRSRVAASARCRSRVDGCG